MQIIKCTKKLQKEMGLTKSKLSNNDPSDSLLGPWHANLIHIYGKKCVVFVNDKTLFNFIIPDITRDHIRSLSGMFSTYLSCTLADEGIDELFRERILDEHSVIEYKNTDNKSVIGSMNDIALHYTIKIEHEGSLHSTEIPNIIKKLNRMPMTAIKSVFPIKALYESLL